MTEPTQCEEKVLQCPMEAKIDHIIAMQESFIAAFPKDGDGNSDLTGHRSFHDESIAAAKAQAEFWRGLKYDVTRRGIFWAAVVLLGLLALGIRAKIRTFLGV